MKDAGLDIRVDAIGNTFGLWQGSDPELGKKPIRPRLTNEFDVSIAHSIIFK